jgi:hypothetical protein
METLTFAHLLGFAGLNAADVRLLRHQDNRHPGHPTPYVLWRDQAERFDLYQSTQSLGDAAKLNAPYWASFVGLPNNETMFVGLYSARRIGPLAEDRTHPLHGGIEQAGSCDFYELSRDSRLSEYAGRIFVAWGAGYRAWIQRGDGSSKPIVELRREFTEDVFPGFSALILRLSDVETLPLSWLAALSATRGIYLLTCPVTKEQYVGSASADGGFLARWREYQASGHGGNVALKSREPSDYQISVLETVGSGASVADILELENLWKAKLQSRAMGLNRN